MGALERTFGSSRVHAMGGVIGYEWNNNKAKSKAELREKLGYAAAGICGGRSWLTVADEMKSRNYTYTSHEEVTSTTNTSADASAYGTYGSAYGTANETSTTTTTVPVQKTSTTYWRENLFVPTALLPNPPRHFSLLHARVATTTPPRWKKPGWG
jgi:hypothetical protein